MLVGRSDTLDAMQMWHDASYLVSSRSYKNEVSAMQTVLVPRADIVVESHFF
jgi:hypothetical protein